MKEYSHEYADHWFHSPTPIERAGGIWPIRAGQNSAKPHYKMGPRFITYYSLHFVLEGKGTFVEGEHNKSLKRGDLFCLFPNKTHQYFTDSNDCLQMFWLAFDGRQAPSLLHRIGITERSPSGTDMLTDKTRKTIGDISKSFSLTPDNSELNRLSLIYKLFHELSVISGGNKPLNITDDNWIQRSIEYMNIHYSEGITVSDVAEYIGIHRSYFTNAFTSKIGTGPMQHLKSLQMAKSLSMLKNRDYTITEIALSVGYSDLYSFSRAFKSYYDLSPTQFRRHQEKKRQ